MKMTNPNERSKLAMLYGISLLMAVAGKGAIASDVLVQPQTGYRVVVVDEARGSGALMVGDYAAAARLAQMEIASSSTSRRFEGYLTRCVALVGLGDYQSAATACNGAVRAAPRTSGTRDYRVGNLALAKTARGVLFAVSGDDDAARTDFLAAGAIWDTGDLLDKNLALLAAGEERRIATNLSVETLASR